MVRKASRLTKHLTFVSFLLKIWEVFICGGVPELVDGRGLGPRAARRGGSSPPFPIVGEGVEFKASESTGKLVLNL